VDSMHRENMWQRSWSDTKAAYKDWKFLVLGFVMVPAYGVMIDAMEAVFLALGCLLGIWIVAAGSVPVHQRNEARKDLVDLDEWVNSNDLKNILKVSTRIRVINETDLLVRKYYDVILVNDSPRTIDHVEVSIIDVACTRVSSNQLYILRTSGEWAGQDRTINPGVSLPQGVIEQIVHHSPGQPTAKFIHRRLPYDDVLPDEVRGDEFTMTLLFEAEDRIARKMTATFGERDGQFYFNVQDPTNA